MDFVLPTSISKLTSQNIGRPTLETEATTTKKKHLQCDECGSLRWALLYNCKAPSGPAVHAMGENGKGHREERYTFSQRTRGES